METKSILQMARGAISERTDYEMARIIDNILDPNTKATGKRKLTITLEFTPDDDRQTIGVACTAKSTLMPTNPVSTALFLTDDMDGVKAVEMVPQIPGQYDMYGAEQDMPSELKLIKKA